MPDYPSTYRTGDPALDDAIVALIADLDERDREFVFELMVSAVRLSREDVDRGELKMVAAAVKEFRYSFGVFAPYEGIRKCTVFGSARTKVGDPAYTCAHDFAAAIAARDWMIITGAGPGIMEAGHEGAGAENSFGVNIVLPFESDANPVIADDPKLINFKYFFTRKVMFMKESHAFVMLPGGFGTMDEAFELLTLIQTGKSDPAPIVLLDPPGGTYWALWRRFVEIELREPGLISPDDLALVMVTDSIDEAVEEVCRFYRTYHSIRFVGNRLVLRLNRPVGDDELARLNADFGYVLARGEIERIEATEAEQRDDDHLELHRIAFRFDRRSWAGVRRMIDALNDATPVS
ncbi:MAG: TIGR00730 family Rossman fold protein [Acidimicrobiales bacterium]|nr:TIGR00730 family Rossman fold protein [Acidimicrobiales bacterium]